MISCVSRTRLVYVYSVSVRAEYARLLPEDLVADLAVSRSLHVVYVRHLSARSRFRSASASLASYSFLFGHNRDTSFTRWNNLPTVPYSKKHFYFRHSRVYRTFESLATFSNFYTKFRFNFAICNLKLIISTKIRKI